MLKQRPFLIEILTAIGLIAAPFVLPYLGFAPNTVNRILVWGLFGSDSTSCSALPACCRSVSPPFTAPAVSSQPIS